ncbi:hypothetical protein E0Z10_g6061 [Xylaria hypoxylon]|uniref:Peptidase S8/S53 domain-containing protein n=1 Tax=Xylaria hypoxylon TaxID=37992 RepID=A0A4Z0Z290_9PEZI|nr:hypothetical protein E0Z10_g6061 [Xylaria hypoxylon]
MLLKRYLKLAIQFQPAEPFSELVASSVDEEDRKLPVFSWLRSSDTDSPVRRQILERLMGQLPISQLREHLTGPSWFGKEMSLDITSLAFDPSLLDFFVYFIRKELARVEDGAATAGSPSNSRQKLPSQQQPPPPPSSTQQQTVQYRHRHRPPSMVVVSRSGVDFEHALKYVNIPSFETGTAERHTEALSIFRWLKCKDVERVFQVHVDDCRHHPHSEEDIEKALAGLDIRELDWRRVDLSAISVSAAAPGVEKLWLYSSGNLAVLDHWFGENGICTLPNLRNVYIKIIHYTFLGESRALQCQDICLNGPHPQGVEVDVSIATRWGVNMGSGMHGGPAGSVRKFRPVEVTNLNVFLEFCRTDSRIKVGVVYTGISTARFSIDSHAVHGRSFVWTNTAMEFEQEASWWLATDSHGSQMANIISQLDPRCIFSIAQVTDDARYFGKGSVVKLISEGVQIIICSFALRDVVRKAKSMGIIIMCGTSDEGENTDEVWPAAYYTQQEGAVERFDNVLPIVGCDEHGKPSRFSSEAAGRYYFRGKDIDASGTDSELLKEPGVVRGSSVATAMATGIASLILACYHMLLALPEPKVPDAADAPGIVNAIFHKMLQPTTVGPGMPDSMAKCHRLVTASRFFPVDANSILDEDYFIDHIGKLYAGGE